MNGTSQHCQVHPVHFTPMVKTVVFESHVLGYLSILLTSTSTHIEY